MKSWRKVPIIGVYVTISNSCWPDNVKCCDIFYLYGAAVLRVRKISYRMFQRAERVIMSWLEHVFSSTFLLPREAPGLSAWGGRSSIIELDKSAASLKPTSFWSTLEISRRCYIIDFSHYSPYKPTNNRFWKVEAFHENTRWVISILNDSNAEIRHVHDMLVSSWVKNPQKSRSHQPISQVLTVSN